MRSIARHSSSFRDPSGFLFLDNGQIYRQINQSYKEHYDQLMNSGLYKKLADEGLLCFHHEICGLQNLSQEAYKVIKPEVIPFISYPHEWCFSQLKDAALTTLKIQQVALENDMILKDASAYNIQFKDGKPVLIDTLSFKKYSEGTSWVAYRQFCQHFLAPLALMACKDVRLNQLHRVYIDGIPLDLASTLLPIGTYFKLQILIHIHIHAHFQKRYSDKELRSRKISISRDRLISLMDTLKSAVTKLKWDQKKTEWSSYYDDLSYTEAALNQKQRLIEAFIGDIQPTMVWDIGANTGFFSRVASKSRIPTVSMDYDHSVVDTNYSRCKENNERHILPLVIDLTNPTSSFGWSNEERMSLLDRGPVDVVLALALIHHLRVSNNTPLGSVAQLFSNICKWLIIEFIPKTDPKFLRLIANREDIFPDYTKDNFERLFGRYFTVKRQEPIYGSERDLYLMERIY